MLANGHLTSNLRDGVLSKCTKLCISSVTVALFSDRRSKLASVWCYVSVITNKVFWKMNPHPQNFNSFTAPNGHLNTNPRDGVSFKSTELYNSSVLVCFFLPLRSDLTYVIWFAVIIRNMFF